MRKRRKARRNAFFGGPFLHARAARLGWGRRKSRHRRKSRRNAGSLSVRAATGSIKAGFNPHVLKRAAVILGGNISTTWFADKVMDHVSMLRSNKFLNIATVLAAAGVNGYLAGRFSMTRKYANDLFIGGILAGVTRIAKTFLPGTFSACGLSEDLDGLSDWMVSPGNIARAYHGTSGLAWAPGPGTPQIGTSGWGPVAGLSDHAVYPQVQPSNVVTLDGLANAEVEREIAMSM